MTIAEVSREYDLSADTLRYYERIGLLPSVPRTAGGIRDYDENACNWIEFIKCMRTAGLSIEVLNEYVSLFRQGNSTAARRKELLTEQRAQLTEHIRQLQETVQRLDYKIENYDKILEHQEKTLRGNSPQS